MEKVAFYETSDIVLASTLKVRGFVLHEIKLEGTKGIFVFKEVDQSTLDDFDLGNIKVEPVEFNNTIKQLTTSVRRKL